VALFHVREYSPRATVDGQARGAQTARVKLDSLRLETPRLLLRPTRREDFEPWASFVADPESARFVGGVQPRSVAWRGFLSMVGAWHIQGFAMFSVIEKASGRWIGRIGPWQPEGWPGTEIGWGIVRDRCGFGYATEAARATIDWAFTELGWTEVIHTIDVDNTASQVDARKLGSRNRGRCRLPAPYSELVIDVWGQTHAEWSARPPAPATNDPNVG
jgi:RimJ/RimL family protein N-acetyltransferase